MVALALTAGAALAAAGTALPLPPVGDPGRLGTWWTDQGPAVAAFSVMRLAGLIGAGYLALVGSMALLGALTRWRWTLSLSRWMARPALTRFLVGGSLVAALSTPAEAVAHPASLLAVTDTGPAATSADSAAGFAVTDTGPATMRARPAVEAATAGFTITDTGPGTETRITGAVFDDQGAETPIAQHRPAEMWTVEDSAAADPGPETWIVEAGDHLWAIAAETVADRTGRTDDESVHAYWQRLIEANRHVVGDDPDLIHPGLVIKLPE